MAQVHQPSAERKIMKMQKQISQVFFRAAELIQAYPATYYCGDVIWKAAHEGRDDSKLWNNADSVWGLIFPEAGHVRLDTDAERIFALLLAAEIVLELHEG